MVKEGKRNRVHRETPEQIKERKTENCRVICLCSSTSTLHIAIPIIKCLSKLGTVQVITEDKSLLLLSKEMNSSFRIGDIFFRHVEELSLMEGMDLDDYHYNLLITQEFLPVVEADKYIMLNNRHHFRSQFDNVEMKYIPISSVLNPQGLSREDIKWEKANVFVNETLTPAPSYASVEQHLNTVLMQKGDQELKFDGRIVNFVVELLAGIDRCTKSHIRQCLMERGDTFASTS